MLEVAGMDAAGIERVAAIYEPLEARAFTVDAIAKRAEHDLVAAMDAAEATNRIKAYRYRLGSLR